MRKKLIGTDAYLEGWRKSRPKTMQGDPQEVAQAIATELEASYQEIAQNDLSNI